jgi:hypothetical protein
MALASKRPKICGAGAVVAVATILASVTVAGAAIVLFAVFNDDQGTVQTQSSDPTTLNASNAFFDPSIGTNGQVCHLPRAVDWHHDLGAFYQPGFQCNEWRHRLSQSPLPAQRHG